MAGCYQSGVDRSSELFAAHCMNRQLDPCCATSSLLIIHAKSYGIDSVNMLRDKKDSILDEDLKIKRKPGQIPGANKPICHTLAKCIN
eukprot:scaffold56021_cov31-Prasinocladus_malaysianus.AAC.1